MAYERIGGPGDAKFRGLLAVGDPYGEVRSAQHAKETLRGIYDINCAEVGAATVKQVAEDLQDLGMPRRSQQAEPLTAALENPNLKLVLYPGQHPNTSN